MLERPLMVTAWVLSAVLLSRFAVDFIAEGPELAVPFWALAMLCLAVMGVNALSRPKRQTANRDTNYDRRIKAALLLFIPIGFIASSLDCTGLSLRGCSPFCTFIKLIWIPVIAVACIAYYVSADRRGPAALLLMSLVPLFPHCICYNVANAWWIDHIGASPECYVWGFVVCSLALGAVQAGKRYLVTAALSLVIIAGSLCFFIGHHYFKFPW